MCYDILYYVILSIRVFFYGVIALNVLYYKISEMEEIMRKKIIVLVITMLLFSLVGCGSNKGKDDSTKTEIVLWHTLTDHHAAKLQEIVDRYNATIDDYVIVLQAQPLQDYEAKVMQAVRNGTGPDIVFAFPTAAANYLEDALIVNYSEFLDDETIGIPDFKDSLPAAVYDEITQWDGNVYLIPVLKTGEVLFYNKTLLDSLGFDAPETWSDVEEISRAALAETGKPGFGFDSVIDGVTALIIQAGSGYIDADKKEVVFANDIAAGRLQWFGDLVKEGVFRLVGEDTYFSNPFGSQAVAMYVGSSAGYEFVLSAIDGAFDLGITGLPQEGPNKYASSWGSNLMIFKSTPEKEKAAYEFIKYFISPEVNAEWVVAFGGVSPYYATQEVDVHKDYIANNPVAEALMKTLENVGYLPSITGSTTVRNELGKAAEEVATGLKEALQALIDAANASNPELK